VIYNRELLLVQVEMLHVLGTNGWGGSKQHVADNQRKMSRAIFRFLGGCGNSVTTEL
jgi:hypothetical protein